MGRGHVWLREVTRVLWYTVEKLQVSLAFATPGAGLQTEECRSLEVRNLQGVGSLAEINLTDMIN